MDEEQQIKAERIKALLAGYYGGGGPNDASKSPGKPGDSKGAGAQQAGISAQHLVASAPVTMDSPAFNAERHITQILKTCQLEKLMVEHRNMAREIKNLDSDMQQLVYENYNKFISATDTIRAMKSNVDGMGTEMDKLSNIIGELLPCWLISPEHLSMGKVNA